MSYEDPFDNAPDENVKEIPVVEEAAPKPTAAFDGEGKLTITFKGTGGYADRWVVAHVATPQEGLDLLKDPAFKELLDYSRKIALYDKAEYTPASAPVSAAPQQNNQPNPSYNGGAPQQAQEAPNGEKRFCSHGEMVFKSGVSKAGNSYKLFSCTAPRDQQCKAQYLNK